MNILYELYNGNINPSEKFIKSDSEYKKLLDRLTELTDTFIQKLDCDTKAMWEEICDTEFAMQLISDRESFTDGFCLKFSPKTSLIATHCENRTQTAGLHTKTLHGIIPHARFLHIF